MKFILVVGICLTNNWRGRGKYCSVNWLCNFCCYLVCPQFFFFFLHSCCFLHNRSAFVSGLYCFFIWRLSETDPVNNMCCFFILFYFLNFLSNKISISISKKKKKRSRYKLINNFFLKKILLISFFFFKIKLLVSFEVKMFWILKK